MRRNVQLWRFHEAGGDPAQLLPMTHLHRFLLEQRSSDLAHTSTDGYETHLVPVSGSAPHLELHRIRQNDLPSERRAGRIVDLDPSVNELAEGSHFLSLPHNLIAFIGTGFSPRPGRLAEWMRSRLSWDITLEPVLRRDAGAILDNLRKITSVEVKIAADEAHRLDVSGFFRDERDPLGALLVAQRAQQGGIITVGWSVGQGTDAHQGWFRELVQRLREADLTGFRAAKAKIYLEGSDNAVPVDFIHDKIVTEVEVDQPSGRQRLLAAPAALDAMQRAWHQFQNN